jgi:hypothetical protein
VYCTVGTVAAVIRREIFIKKTFLAAGSFCLRSIDRSEDIKKLKKARIQDKKSSLSLVSSQAMRACSVIRGEDFYNPPYEQAVAKIA